MPQRLEHLRETLAELHAELESVESSDEETAARLREAMDEIQALLDKQDAAALGEATLGDRLAESARGFEQSHPALAHLVGNILDALGRIGI